MSKKRDFDDVAKMEKAISDKFGEESIRNPKSSWTEEKEKKYLEELKSFYGKNKKIKKEIEAEGFKIRKKRVENSSTRRCPVCSNYSFSVKDDLYMTKFECCFECYIQYIEGREERWNSGWRPNS